MLNFIIVGHGTFASRMKILMSDLHYDINRSFFIDYPETMTPFDLDKELKKIVSSSKEDFLIIADLQGTAPYTKSVAISLENSHVRVISGCSLPMLKSLSINQNKPLAELIEILQEDAINAIKIE